MITGYQVRTMINHEEVLVLYIQMEEEFSLEWFDKLKTKGFQDFIHSHKILWNGTKVFLVVGGITLAVLNYQPPQTREVKYISDALLSPLITENKQVEESKEEVLEETIVKEDIFVGEENHVSDKTDQNKLENPPKQNSNTNFIPKPSTSDSSSTESPSKPPQNTSDLREDEPDVSMYVTVYRSNGSVIRLSMEEYLIGVVAAEMPASFQLEALKTQSILARTYAMKVIDRGGRLTDTVSTQRYIDQEEMKKQWGSSYSTYYQKIKNAVISTENLVVTYGGTLIDAVYHSTSNGKTENSENVWGNAFPYLKSVDSRWDISATSYARTVSFSKSEFCRIFGLSEDLYSVQILGRNQSGRVSSIQVGNTIYTGVKFREMLGLRSADFDISLNDEGIVVTTRGYGHGVGLSQYGANGMAKEGYSASKILKHYYSGVEVVSLKK